MGAVSKASYKQTREMQMILCDSVEEVRGTGLETKHYTETSALVGVTSVDVTSCCST